MNDHLRLQRRFFAEEIRAVANLQTPALVDALATVPRERFLGPGPWDIAMTDPRRPGALLYRRTPDDNPAHLCHNVLVAIDKSRELNNGHPQTLASCLDALALRTGETFMHVGCGVGYYTALGAAVVGSTGRVFAVEIDPMLAAKSTENLRYLPHITVVAGDGSTYQPASCDAILVNAGFTHPLDIWVDALNDGGRLLMPITSAIPNSPISHGWMMLITRDGSRFHARGVMHMAIFASPTGRDDALNAPILKALQTSAWGRVTSLRRDAHEPSDTCCVHNRHACLSFD